MEEISTDRWLCHESRINLSALKHTSSRKTGETLTVMVAIQCTTERRATRVCIYYGLSLTYYYRGLNKCDGKVKAW